jgi:hypothetical protein
MKHICNLDTPHLGGNIRSGDPHTFAPSVWDYVLRRFCIQSVLDLGSGLGYSSSYFFKSGCKVLAVDGLESNCRNASYPTLEFDLTKGKINTKVDLVHCQEVVEHIEEKYLDNLLGSMCTGQFILMTNALPGQGGYHHVNEQPTEYWISHFTRLGYVVLHEDTLRIRRLAEVDGAIYLARTGLLLEKDL